MAETPLTAQDYLRENPTTWKQYRDKFGSLPEDFTPPPASEAAVEYLRQNPDTAEQFAEHFGYSHSFDEKDAEPVQTVKEEVQEERAKDKTDAGKAAAAVAGVNARFSNKGGAKGGQFSNFSITNALSNNAISTATPMDSMYSRVGLFLNLTRCSSMNCSTLKRSSCNRERSSSASTSSPNRFMRSSSLR